MDEKNDKLLVTPELNDSQELKLKFTLQTVGFCRQGKLPAECQATERNELEGAFPIVFFFPFLAVCQPSRLMQRVVPYSKVPSAEDSVFRETHSQWRVLGPGGDHSRVLESETKRKSCSLRLPRRVKLPLPEREASAG